MKKHLITYGDDFYKSQREFLRETATASGFFDEIQIFTPGDIDTEFADSRKDILQRKTGGGYWIWKPYFIKKVLGNIETDDVLIYCDAGCMINKAGKERFNDYIDMLIESDTGTIDFKVPHREYEYTKQEVFDYFGSSEEIINSDQLMSTILLFRKCAHSSMLVDKWYNTVYDQASLFTDEQRVHQHPDFIDHRHDQSVFSVIRKTYGANIFTDETYFLDFIRYGQKFPLWAARLRN